MVRAVAQRAGDDSVLVRPFIVRVLAGSHGYIERKLSTRYNNPMDKTIHKYTSLDAMKADEYRYWQSRSVQERMDAVSELTLAVYAMKGAAPDVPRLQRTLVRLQHPLG
jgi:hypothetical protein